MNSKTGTCIKSEDAVKLLSKMGLFAVSSDAFKLMVILFIMIFFCWHLLVYISFCFKNLFLNFYIESGDLIEHFRVNWYHCKVDVYSQKTLK